MDDSPSLRDEQQPKDEQQEKQQQQDQQQQQQQEQQQERQQVKECLHRTKTIQFLGRKTPIVLQNDNGPCPLLAICNVLLLRNNLNLSPDISEVSQEKLLSLVAERLIDSNSNVNNKDAGYVENQQQNIADAIDLLPRLATGIDVNIKFRRIDDFEFTPECAIYDLLDIPLYHGWIVDPQDFDTAIAIESKSYNALMGELVALETQNMEDKCKTSPGEDCVDFVAATTATLGVPSPSLSKTMSFDESPRSIPDQEVARKGDLLEESELIRALKLSETEFPSSVGDSPESGTTGVTLPVSLDESQSSSKDVLVASVNTLDGHTDTIENQNIHQPEESSLSGITPLSNDTANQTYLVINPAKEESSIFKADMSSILDQSAGREAGENVVCDGLVDKGGMQVLVDVSCSPAVLVVDKIAEPQIEDHNALFTFPDKGSTESVDENHMGISLMNQNIEHQTTGVHEFTEKDFGCHTAGLSRLTMPNTDTDSRGRSRHDEPEPFTPSVDGSEPMYEGEECILDSGTTAYEVREPVYEGEIALAEQANNSVIADSCQAADKDGLSPEQGELIRNYLKNTASQLTFYGLFCLQDGLKERELCVFFRNNHFSTMFKYDGELYLLATDQGYLNEPDLVWEKLNEVNGDTLFMTGNFKEFNAESQTNSAWNEHNAMTSTADYLASIDGAAQAGLDMTSDMQLAIALQQQEFEEQPQRQNTQQHTVGASGLVTGPQVASSGRSSSSSSAKPVEKLKEKCTIM